MDNIHIIGTSHIASQSLQEIKHSLLTYRPDVIAVELDKQRLQSLDNPQQQGKPGLKAIRQLGFGGFLFVTIGSYIQKKLGRIVGMQPGADMKYAADLARRNKLQLLLIDRSLQYTVKKLMKKITIKEKLRLFKDVLLLPFAGIIQKIAPRKKSLGFDLRHIPKDDVLSPLLEVLRKKYPTFYTVLIDERNHVMAKKLVRHAKKHPEHTIVAVVGAGHKKGIQNLIAYYDTRIEVV